MSELPKENQELDQDVDQSRRKLAKIGAAAPVIMTLASKPVFGAQCLSQMMSGNVSQQGDGSCSLGWSPGGWCGDHGKVNNMPTRDAWVAAGFDMGVETVTETCVTYHRDDHPSKPGECKTSTSTSTFVGGSLVNADSPFTMPESADIGDRNPNTITMREVICDPHIHQELRHCLAAYLNASLPNFNYILTKAQVIGLCEGSIPLPLGYSLNSFLDSTWEKLPGE